MRAFGGTGCPTVEAPRARLHITATLVLLMAAACGDPPEPRHDLPPREAPAVSPRSPLPFPVPASVTGDLILQDGGLAFHRCGAEAPVALRDRTPGGTAGIVEELGYGRGRVLAAVVLDRNELLEVRYAVPEGPGCETLLPKGDLVARGNEPFWSLRLEEDQVRWITPDDMEGAVHAPARWEPAAAGDSLKRWTLTAGPAAPKRDGEAPGGPLTLHLTLEGCVDTMSGARFPFTVQADRDGRTWTGCAVEGRRSGAAGHR